MNRTTTMKRWLAAISLVVLGGGMSACADGTSWKEEVLLQDGKKLIVERSVVRKGRHEPFQQPTIGEQSINFDLPATHQRVRWKDEYSEDLGHANFLPMMLEINKDIAYLVASPLGCLSYNKWGRPNPPYVVFKFQDGNWKRIALQELPARFKIPNLIMSSPDDAAKQTRGGLITAEMVGQINNKGPFSAAYPQPPQYKTILREPMKSGAMDCPVMVRIKDGWGSPGGSKAPIPIKPAVSNEAK